MTIPENKLNPSSVTVAIFSILVGITSAVIAHDVEVHSQMSRNAVLILDDAMVLRYMDQIVQGSIDEDLDPPVFGPCDHAYNPRNGRGWGFPCLGNALDGAADAWNNAVGHYRDNDCRQAFYWLGRAMHFVQDMTSPAHVHSDVHIGAFGFGGDDFENWGRDGGFQVDPGIACSGLGGWTARDFVDWRAEFTYGKSTFAGVLEETERQPSSDFQRMFPSLHFDDGGIFGTGWVIDKVGTYDNFFRSNDWWPSENDHNIERIDGLRRISGNMYIENSGGDNENDESLRPRPQVWPPGSNTPNSMTLLSIWGEEFYHVTICDCVALIKNFLDLENVICPVGHLRVNITPFEAVRAGAVWRRGVDGQWGQWRPPGLEINIPAGSYEVEFFPLAGWSSPERMHVLIEGGLVAEVTGEYIPIGPGPDPDPEFGSLRVTILPSEVNDLGAAWRLGDDQAWYKSGSLLTDIEVGSYPLEFLPVPEWDEPNRREIEIRKGENPPQIETYICTPLAKQTVYVDNQYTGEFEKGTEQFPFRTVKAALPFVEAGGTVFIAAGRYPEDGPVTISNKMMLVANGGLVIIGR